MMTQLAFFLALLGVELTPTLPQGASCWRTLGRQSYFGSAEQVRTLQEMVKARPPAKCPQLGLGFSTQERTSIVAYDRPSGVIIRFAVWQGESHVKGERWEGASDATLLRDDPDDGFDQGRYQIGNVSRASIPPALRGFVRKHGGRVGVRVP